MRTLRIYLLLVFVIVIGVSYSCSKDFKRVVRVCADSFECPEGFVCRDNYCIDETDPKNLCKDDNDCPEELSCIGGACRLPSEQEVSDGDFDSVDYESDITQETVEPENNINCDDGNPCTRDVLEGLTCAHYPDNEGAPCNDGNAHTENDRCQNGECRGDFVESNMCCGEECKDCTRLKVENGEYVCKNGDCAIECDAGNVEVSGVCVPLDCDDGNPCTYDGFTDDGHHCAHAPVDDGTGCYVQQGVCSFSGECLSGVCENLVATNCDDGIDCTVDSCDPENGCINTPEDSLCGEGEHCDPQQGCVENSNSE